MQFTMPVKAFFGDEVLWQHRSVLKNLGTKAILVTGRTSGRKSGALDATIKSLSDQGISYVIFDEIEENPSVATVLKGAEKGRNEGADFVIGIGGGSPLDAAKAIALCMKNPELNDSNLFSQPPLSFVPVAAVPTTSGTGSEVTQYAILTDHIDQTKKNLGQVIFPVYAFLEPRFTESLPLETTRHTAVDAFTHLAEGYLNANASPVSDALAEKGFQVFGQSMNALDQGVMDSKLRADLMLASMLAGMVIAQTGTSLPHGLGYALTYHHGLSHGLANGVLFSAYLDVFKDKSKVSAMVKALGLSDLDELQTWLRKMTACDLQIELDTLERYAAQMAANQAKLKNHPEKVSDRELLGIYLKSIDQKS